MKLFKNWDKFWINTKSVIFTLATMVQAAIIVASVFILMPSVLLISLVIIIFVLLFITFKVLMEDD